MVWLMQISCSTDQCVFPEANTPKRVKLFFEEREKTVEGYRSPKRRRESRGRWKIR